MGSARSSNLYCKITILLIICCFSLSAQGKYGGGSGTPNDPYQIRDANHMNAIGADSNDWDKHFILMADIDLAGFTGTSFNIIGYYASSSDNKPFTGVFDGNDHTISNFTYNSTETGFIGLFGYVDEPNAQIKNLGLLDPNVDAGTGNFVGSLVGWIGYGTISNCYASGDVSGYSLVGGLVGWNVVGTITNCYASGDVSGYFLVGGLVGENSVGTITNCYSTGSVSGDWFVGGLVGENFEGTITNCYATGSVSGDSVGGLVGSTNWGNVSASFWDIETSGQDSSDGGTGLPTAEMQMQSTFTDAGWDFVGEVINGPNDIWTICEGEDYPRLWWEKYGGGNGTEANPYLIRTSCQMNAIGADSNDWDKHFILMADIDLSSFTGTSFNIIGTYRSNPFTGTFDGNDHTISNFTYTSTGTNYIGLFGYIRGENAEINNLGLTDPNVDVGTGWLFGSLVGWIEYGTITNCYVQGGSVVGELCVGGLVGGNGGTITNCYSTGSVSGDWDLYVGGLVGLNEYGTITNCYATGSVTGGSCVGGLVGNNYAGTITNCYSTGSVSGDWDLYVGGLVGGDSFGYINDSFWDIETSGQDSSDGGTGLPTAEMQMQSTFTDAGWDFSTPIWKMNCEGMSYPKLSWWQPVLGDFGCPDGVDFVDYSFFASHWAEDNCGASNDCDGTDLDLLETVDINDLRIFVDNWLLGF